MKIMILATILVFSWPFDRMAVAVEGKTAKETYTESCSDCHGDDGKGTKSPKSLEESAKERVQGFRAMLKEKKCEITAEEEKKLTVKRRQPDFTSKDFKKRLADDKKNGYKELIDIVKNGKFEKIKYKCKDEKTEKPKDMEFEISTRMPGNSIPDKEIEKVLDYIGGLQ